DVPVDPGDAEGVVPRGADGAGGVGAVGVVVERIGVVVDEVVAVVVVGEPVVVVVDAIIGDLPRVVPHVGGEVGVVVVDARVDVGDGDAAAAGGEVPGLGRVDVGVWGAVAQAGDELPGVVHAVELPERRVVRIEIQGIHLHQVGLDVAKARQGGQGGVDLL